MQSLHDLSHLEINLRSIMGTKWKSSWELMKCHCGNNLISTMETKLFEMGNNNILQWKYIIFSLNSIMVKRLYITMEIVMGNNKVPKW